MSQDHLELFFGAIRAYGGSNNNPTVREFVAAYKRMMMRQDIEIVTVNATPQDDTAVLSSASCITAMRTAVSDDTEDIMVARRYDLPVTSEDDDLSTIPDLPELSIFRELTKDRGGLRKPSEGVVEVCLATEKLFQKLLFQTKQKLPQTPRLADIFAHSVLQQTATKAFISLSDYMFDTEPDNNHVFQLIKAVTRAYCKICMHHLVKQYNTQITGRYIRKTMSKMILFKHQ
ncbi:hypothetical protein BaRGS_00032046 [Batillaria attramentaria]|uniref:Transposable element P transposase-like RNase H C-terminal domain-containing protein n=1 Tax=Batillaria attramentaria TaxID=370345 RepID=A0ABD0JPP8_9CAEN